MTNSTKWRIIKYSSIIVAVLLVLGAAVIYIRSVSIPHSHVVRAEFDRLPANDKELEEWLRNQPGVIKVLIDRRDGQALIVCWIRVHKINENPPNPDLEQAWKQFGYENPKNIDWNYSD